MSLFKLDDHYNQLPYRYERERAVYMAAKVCHIFNYEAYCAYHFKNKLNPRIMVCGKGKWMIGEKR